MSNNLNQYTSIQEASEAAFTPQFDADGNQTLIKTETGIWTAVYNAENRPVSFTNEATGTVVSCAYDSMGRRSFKKVTVNGTVTLHRRYLYRGYLQIACCDLTRTAHPCLWLITWDPSEPIATRPLAIQKDGTWYTYGLDLTKNVCELFGTTGYIATTYTYSPYGSVTSTGSVTQPIQWSSEYLDKETNLAYYNYRFYSAEAGCWINRDAIQEKFTLGLYVYLDNNPVVDVDILGESGAKAREEEKRRTRHKKNQEGRKKNQEIERQKSKRAGHAAEAALEAYEAAEAIGELVRDSKDGAIYEGLKKCNEYMSNNPNVCKACCYIYLSMHSKVYGQVRYAKYSLYQVKITTGNTCSYIRENPGFWNEESLYKAPGEMQGVQDLANPDKIIYEPVIEMTF